MYSSFDSDRYGLAIHTASPDLGLAISNFAGDDRAQAWALGREVSSYLHLYLSKFIQPQTWQDLAFIAVAKGPGGFTGTRLGVVTARTLAQQLDLPLFAISTLAAVAWTTAESLLEANQPLDIAVEMSAQRGEVHSAIYRVSVASRNSANLEHLEPSEPNPSPITAQLPDSVMSQERWQQTLSAWQRPYQLVQAEGGLGSTTASILTLAYLEWQAGNRPHWSAALPFYGQNPVG